jgi:carbon monoxide dehydrogenase subunit G
LDSEIGLSMIIEVKHTINAPADKVWATFKSFDYVEKYNPLVQKTEVQGSGVGATRICYFSQPDGNTGKLSEKIESLDESQKIISISIADGILPATNAVVTVKFNALDGNKTELDFSGTAEPKGISEEDLQNNFLPVFKMTAEGLEKLHSN